MRNYEQLLRTIYTHPPTHHDPLSICIREDFIPCVYSSFLFSIGKIKITTCMKKNYYLKSYYILVDEKLKI